MKTKLLAISLLVILTSCSNSDDAEQEEYGNFYAKVSYSLTGNKVNGTFSMEALSPMSQQTGASTVYVPTGVNGNSGEAAGAYILDFGQLTSFSIMTPAREGLVEILGDNTNGFEIAFGFEEFDLSASSVSVNITKLIMRNITEDNTFKQVVAYVGHFEGIVNHEYYNEDNELITEPHLANGEFEFYHPVN
ncbi:MAG TPA: hypothetical protein PKL92_05745 [Aquaticitalea sp.]|nr:hypothetical protein [Aquaticitalea sp.]